MCGLAVLIPFLLGSLCMFLCLLSLQSSKMVDGLVGNVIFCERKPTPPTSNSIG